MRSIQISVAAFLSFVFLSACSSQKSEIEYFDGGEESSIARNEWELKMLADPATGMIPENIRAKELAFAATLPKMYSSTKGQRGEPFWKPRGPWNVGGRTRAIAIDVTNENTIFAAGVSGGIWRSTNGGVGWQKITKPNQLLNVTCIVQDTRPGKTKTWYAGTGEYLGNSASGGGAFYYGDGILKSTDGGLTWSLLASTSSGKPQTFSKDFNLVYNIAINTADTANTVYAATYSGIYKTTDGGAKWTKVRGIGIAGSPITDVAITSKGVIYATLNSEGTQRGIWRSIDGIAWTNITPANFPPNYTRIVIGIDPNDENRVYFFAATPGYGKKGTDVRKREDWSSLFCYTYLNGNGSGTGGQWEDRSANLPTAGGGFGDINTQGGYDMYVRVQPGDAKTVYIGATNIWRSTDAFTTTSKTSWIGGYGPGSKLPDYTYVPNHHPDQHNLIFYKSNPKIALSSHDGGISKTSDITATTPQWNSLANGYLTTQFYTVTIDHGTPGKDEIMGGLQDNGTYLTRSSSTQQPWVMPGNGDGSYCAIADGGTDYYTSKQNGQAWHIKLDASGLPTQWARIDPKGAKVTNFIDPFTLDPNNQKRIYFIGGTKIWVNHDVTQIPLKSPKDTNKTDLGWSPLSSQADTSQQIGSIAVSRQPADVLYYGTELGKLWRIDDASTGSKPAVNITSSLFPLSGYISNICIDPLDANKVIVVFSNYNVQSLFYTTDAGKTWTNISGNLEQNANGSGNGPSCRWANILPVKDKRAYFIATSTGLYSTDTLMGANTVWTQQDPEGIGNNICTMLDSRPSDGFLVIVTHGNGVYSANINFTYQVTGIKKATNTMAFEDARIYPNPMKDAGRIEFRLAKTCNVKIEILDELGRIVSVIHDGTLSAGKHDLPIRNDNWKQGVYYCRVSGDDGVVTKVFLMR
jgi:hypothetical protein